MVGLIPINAVTVGRGAVLDRSHCSSAGQSERDVEATVRAWDLAATGITGRNDPDWTVGIKLSRDRTGRYLILDTARIHVRSRN